MTFKEQIKPYVYCYMGSGMLSDTYDEGVADECAEKVEQIADDFAKNFYRWVQVCKRKGRPYDFDNVHELLKTFKEEE